MKLTLKTISFVLAGSGATSGLIDTDISFIGSGFPFIPAKRIKGLLKESLIEVLEILGESQLGLVEKIFGEEGDAKANAGIIRVGNGFLEGWTKIKKESKDYKDYFSQEKIIEFFTSEISQTTIDEKSGIAKSRSLRNYRVLNPGFDFEFEISFKDVLEPNEKDLFSKCVSNLRYMGSRRNRGWGKIKCSLINQDDGINYEVTKENKFDESLEISEIKVTAKTLEPVILSKTDSDQNTVGSFPFISGNKLRGVLVNRFIKHYGNVNENWPLFYELFLSGKISFGSLTIEGSRFLPLNIHYKKDDENQILDVFQLEDSVITKPIGGVGIVSSQSIGFDVEQVSPKFSSQFHLSRRGDRSAGTSTKSEGSIFYYVALNEGQNFEGTIKGDKDVLKKLVPLINNDFVGFLGKSKSAQYGKTKFEFQEVKNDSSKDKFDLGNNFYLNFLSPVILLNDFGVAEPSENILKRHLTRLLVSEIEIINRAVTITNVEQFNVQWNSKTTRMAGYGAGSVFEIVSKTEIFPESFEMLIKIGIGEYKEIGYGRVEVKPKFKEEIQIKRIESRANLEPDKQNQPGLENLTHPLLKEIHKNIEKKNKESEIKSEAIKSAITEKQLNNNHLLGIMIQVFIDAKNKDGGYDYIKDWLDKAGKITENKNLKWQSKKMREPKPAFKSLEKVKLVNKNKLEESKLLKEKESFSEGFLYWTTYFKTMQKRNKQSRQKN